MRYSFLLTAGTLVSGTSAAWISPEARNFIYVMPDGEFYREIMPMKAKSFLAGELRRNKWRKKKPRAGCARK